MPAERVRIEYMTPEAVERLKQASRDADARALASGKVTPRDLERKHAFLLLERTIVRWDRSGRS